MGEHGPKISSGWIGPQNIYGWAQSQNILKWDRPTEYFGWARSQNLFRWDRPTEYLWVSTIPKSPQMGSSHRIFKGEHDPKISSSGIVPENICVENRPGTYFLHSPKSKEMEICKTIWKIAILIAEKNWEKFRKRTRKSQIFFEGSHNLNKLFLLIVIS